MKKVFKYIVLALLAVVVVWTFVFLWQKSRPKVVVYEIETVSKNNIEKRTVATGTIEPRNEILIKPQVSGIIEEIYKEAGDVVKQGDIIAKIKVIPDMTSLSSAESRLKRAKIALEQSEKNYEREKQLYNDNVSSKETFEKVELQYNNDIEELKSAEENLSIIRDGVSNDKSMSSNTLIRSTINGTILDIPVKVGNSVIQSNNFNDGTTIATVANMNDMLFVGKLDETEVGRIKVGMSMDISIGALQDTKLTALLEYISPKGVEESGAIMFEMKAALTIPDTVFIRSGYSANADILFDKRDSVLTIPESCVEFSNDSVFVQYLLAEEPQTFEKKAVEIGISDGINIEIKKGLALGDKVRGKEKVEEKK